MPNIRPPAVAGTFYPSNSNELAATILSMLNHADANLPIPKAIIAPHAGYIYSGEIAAAAYASLTQATNTIKQVILLGPAHRYPVRGMACPEADFFATPLGEVAIDHGAIAKISSSAEVIISDAAHAQEHCLEVQLPFLQVLLKNFTLVPIMIGFVDYRQVAKAITELYGDKQTLIIVSSDLSHYHDYNTAQMMDKNAATAILNLNPDNLGDEQACGRIAIKGLLQVAIEKRLAVKQIDLRNSGDTAGPKDQVVGYGAFHFYEK